MFQLWLCKESVPVGLLVEGLLLVLGEGVPGEGVVDGGDHAAVGVDWHARTPCFLCLSSTVRAQNPT